MLYTEFFRKYDNKDDSTQPVTYKSRVGASLAVQIHTTGARPMFKIGSQTVTPESYDSRFDSLFKQRLLNRHPNESDELYNWRLAVYSPISQEISDKFLNFAKGCIMQPNNYVISVDDKTNEYLETLDLRKLITDLIQFTFENPKGSMAVIVDNYDGQPTTLIQPKIKNIYPGDVLMNDDDSVAFVCEGNIYYLNKEIQVKRDASGVYQTIPHNFGTIPFWGIDNEFALPFVNWADLLVRNMNDDEMMTKQYSYPIKQTVLPACQTCSGNGKISELINPENPATGWHNRRCDSCEGTGKMSVNPGQLYTVTEESLIRNNYQMPDLAKFITPDVSIPEYHMQRWQLFYDKCQESLFLKKKINATESGDAKKEDRKDQYTFLSTFSRFVFDNIRKALGYVSAYRNFNNSTAKYEAQQIVVIAPKQLDLMTDADIVTELIDIQGKTDDSMVLGESAYGVMHKVLRDDPVMGKINDILYEYDPLYGVSGMALKSKYLSGVYSEEDKIIHEKGYKALLKIAREMDSNTFVEMDSKLLAAQFMEAISALTPQGIYA